MTRPSNRHLRTSLFFFFNDTATTEIYTLSLHDALPISHHVGIAVEREEVGLVRGDEPAERSEEHTSELQSRSDLVCRLLLEKKKILTRFIALSISQQLALVLLFARPEVLVRLPSLCTVS